MTNINYNYLKCITTPSTDSHTYSHSTYTHSLLKCIRSTAGDETYSSQSSHLAPCDVPLVCLLQFAPFIPEHKYDCKLWSAKDCNVNALCNK